MIWITLWRIAQAGVRNFLRNAWLSTAATAVMTVTLAIMLVSFLSNYVLSSNIAQVVSKIDISLFLDDKATVEQTTNLQKRLQDMENVESVRYVSKAEAFKEFKNSQKGDKRVFEIFSETDNPLPASLQIKVKDKSAEKLEEIARLAAEPDIKPLIVKSPDEEDRKKVIERIVRVANMLRTTGLVASIIFTIISVLIIFNTIRMAIFTRRDEIEIMKLVGATNWFIRGPFIFEAVMYGVIGSVIALTLAFAVIVGGVSRVTVTDINVGSTVEFFKDNAGMIWLYGVAIGIGIGISSSMLAMKRYLKL